MRDPTEQSSTLELPRAAAAKAGDLLPLFDFAGLLLAATLLPYLGAGLLPTGFLSGGHWSALQPLLWMAALLAAFVLYEADFFALALARRGGALLRGYLRRLLVLLGIVSALAYTGGWQNIVPSAGLLLWLGLTVFFTLASRVLLALYLRQLDRLGALKEDVAVIGAGAFADQLIPRIHEQVHLLGVFDDRASRVEHCVHKPRTSVEALVSHTVAERPDRILIALPSVDAQRLHALVEQLRTLRVPVELCTRGIRREQHSSLIGQVGEQLPVPLLADRPIRRWNAVMKAASDFILASLMLLLLLPVFAVIALAIRIDSPGPILFKQRRHGFSNREFDIYKFRTMRYTGAQANAPLQQTLRGDPRVTRVGAFLRKWSLDELPQLFNVLQGDMSLVGPRPHAVNMRTEQRLGHEIIDVYPHRHRVKPGITGWSQVNGSRGATDTSQQLSRRVALDLHYIDHWSLLLDLKILTLTFKEVMKATNAY